MPIIINTNGVKAGCIYRIKLKNFVTYKEVELYPGLSLNMIIGPNGTGKSTFVSALILGLCGNIASIGRSKKISEYIRCDCEEATIEIELYQKCGQPNVKITRVFNNRDISKWYINNILVSQKLVKDLISTFDIQVDNLCQLLPQDRVKDFAKMKPHTLLQSTLSAVGEQKRLEQLENLKKWRSEQCSLINKLQKNEKKKQDLIKKNEILKSRIDTLNQRKEIEREIKVCFIKKLWIEEKLLKSSSKQYENDKKAANKLVKAQNMKIKPLEEAINKVNNEIKALENQKRALYSNVIKSRDQMNEFLRSIRIQKETIKGAYAWYLEMKMRKDDELKELETAKMKLNRMHVDLNEALKKYGDDDAMKSKMHSLNETISNLKTEKYNVNQLKQTIQSEYEQTLFPEMARCRHKISSLENVDRKRLQVLDKYNNETHQALLWFRANKQLFYGSVCEPMMFEIKFLDQRYARYLEGTVSRRDLTAFTFQERDDMNLFLKKVRQEQGLKMVHALHCPSTRENYSTGDIKSIQHLGFQTYLVNTFTAHEMIVRYLCKNYKIHMIPIGNERTYDMSEKVPSHVRLFFSENHRFSTTVSRYSGDVSTSMSEVKTPLLLADTLDVGKISEWKNKLSDLEKDEQKYLNKKRDVDTQLAKLETEYNTYDFERSAIREHANLIKQLAFKIRAQKTMVIEKDRLSVDLVKEKEECVASQRQCVDKQLKLHSELMCMVGNVHNDSLLMDLLSMALEKKRSSIVDRNKELLESKTKFSEAQERLTEIMQLEKDAMEAAAVKLKEALKSSNNSRPEDPNFPFKDIYHRLPEDMEQLQEHRNDLLTKIGCMGEIDEGDLRTYEENERIIKELLTDETVVRKENAKLESSMVKMKHEWTKFVSKLIKDINNSFRDMFAKLGFGGEVKLDKGTCEDDFGSYGVVIMVKFRPGEQLRDLTPSEQSGGERAVSTAIYLFALQHLARAPFRCVDEINQGMDSLNDRKMFEFLVNVTTEGERGQYFLLTPKLLTGLKYNSNITIHTIMNGRGALTYDKWHMDNFIEKL